MVAWNVLMAVSVLGAVIAAGSAVWEKVVPAFDPAAPLQVRIVGGVVLAVAIGFILLVMVGFLVKSAKTPAAGEVINA